MGNPLLHHDITDKIIAAAYNVHNALGEGFAEKVYENALLIELRKTDLALEPQKPIEVYYEGQQVGEYVVDLMVNGVVVVEIKAVRALEQAHVSQLLNYLRATDSEVGLIINFGCKVEFRRLIFTNDRKKKRTL